MGVCWHSSGVVAGVQVMELILLPGRLNQKKPTPSNEPLEADNLYKRNGIQGFVPPNVRKISSCCVPATVWNGCGDTDMLMKGFNSSVSPVVGLRVQSVVELFRKHEVTNLLTSLLSCESILQFQGAEDVLTKCYTSLSSAEWKNKYLAWEIG